MINISLGPLTFFEFGIYHQALNVSRDRNPAMVLEITDAKHSAEVTSCHLASVTTNKSCSIVSDPRKF